jgi:hypothetical protein
MSPRLAARIAGVIIRIVREPTSVAELVVLARDGFGDFVKAVVDVGRGVMAIGGELHADEETLLLDDGARQSDLWGINLYPDREMDDRVEFDSMINVRPAQSNRSRSVDDESRRRQILDVVRRLIV